MPPIKPAGAQHAGGLGLGDVHTAAAKPATHARPAPGSVPQRECGLWGMPGRTCPVKALTLVRLMHFSPLLNKNALSLPVAGIPLGA